MTHTLRKWLAAAVCLMVAVCASLSLAVTSAHAAWLKLPETDSTLEFVHNAVGMTLGISAVDDDGNYYYCIESDVSSNMVIGPMVDIVDSAEARQIAWLIDKYRNQVDAQTQAAIGLLVHDYFDLRKDTKWREIRARALQVHPSIEPIAQRLWAEAVANAPVEATVRRVYTQGLREGVLEVKVMNGNGELLSGVPYTAVLEGPAVFEHGGTTIEGTTGTQPQRHTWKATGQGEVNAYVEYDAGTLEQMICVQDFLRYGGEEQYSSPVASFTVRKTFAPSLSTETGSRKVAAGDVIADDVTVGVQTETDHWPSGVSLQATGWYFDGIDAGQTLIEPRNGETAQEFLIRLESAGHTPSAYGSATFTGAGQTVRAIAVTEPGGSVSYRAPADGNLGTWVWAFERDEQSDAAREYLASDVVTALMETAETNVNQAKLEVSSIVAEHAVAVGEEIDDSITVGGFPDDHGSFAGDESLGLGADRKTAQVSVWWAGDVDDPENDDLYRPSTVDVPEEDEHHALIGVWEYPAKNGRIEVGGGVPDAHGKPVTIAADRHGWYVFVWSFDGDDRVAAVSSAYNDAWERVRVREETSPQVTLTTQVDPERVAVGEPFHDTARIVGDVPEGGYVTFTAYQAVPEGETPGRNATLLDGARVDVDHTATEQTVASPEIRSPDAGLVYWQATLFNKEGDVLASHELGAEGEVVTVEEVTLPSAGASVALVAGIGAAACAVGAMMLAAIRRRTL